MHVVTHGIAIVIIQPHSEIYNLSTSLSIDITQSNAVKWKYRKYPIYIENIKNIENILYFEKYCNIFHPWYQLLVFISFQHRPVIFYLQSNNELQSILSLLTLALICV